jgi:holo-[acyl-carrier protein] synthase
MIIGIGTDIVSVARIGATYERQGAAFARQLLSDSELAEFDTVRIPGPWLAKRWAAKEAFGKAAGTGILVPLTLGGIGVGHDPLGRPFFELMPAVQAHLQSLGVTQTHLSISDEREHAIAFVVFEKSV